jgi:hypothetical protein
VDEFGLVRKRATTSRLYCINVRDGVCSAICDISGGQLEKLLYFDCAKIAVVMRDPRSSQILTLTAFRDLLEGNATREGEE